LKSERFDEMFDPTGPAAIPDGSALGAGRIAMILFSRTR